MPDLNEFIILNIGLYLLCVLVTLTLLVGTIADNAPKRPFMKLFIALLQLILLFYWEKPVCGFLAAI